MSDIWLISDPHFDHNNFLKFTNDDGTKCRPFDTIEDMNELIIQNCITRVKHQDKFYWLGDITMRPNQLGRIMSRIPGHKRLIGGNHDQLQDFELTRWFEKVGIWRIFKEENFVASHVPMHYDCFRHKVQYNVHGHTHGKHIMIGSGKTYRRDPRYVNISVENTDYGPLHIEEIKALFQPLD